MKRILLKMSGESLAGEQQSGISPIQLTNFANQIKDIVTLGHQVAIVIGGGNIFRGLKGAAQGFDRVKGDQMGMLATIINSLALQSELTKLNISAKLYTSIRMEPIGKLYSSEDAITDMNNNNVVIISGGTGNPYFTTDTAAALRAIELKTNLLIKATRVDGVYTEDPEKNPNAQKFESLTFDECIQKQYKILDLTAFTMCKENDMPIVVLNFHKKDELKKLITGEKVGTIIKN